MNKSLQDAVLNLAIGKIVMDSAIISRVIEITKYFLRAPAIKYLQVSDLDGLGQVAEVEETLRSDYRHPLVQALILGYEFPPRI